MRRSRGRMLARLIASAWLEAAPGAHARFLTRVLQMCQI